MEEGIPDDSSIPDKVLAQSDAYREKKEIKLITDETQNGIPWSESKSSTLLLKGKTIKNPFSNRFYYPRPESNTWIQTFQQECK